MTTSRKSSRFVAIALTALALLLQTALPAGAFEKRTLDYSHYDEPLFDQVVDHIRVKVGARLGSDKLAHDRYFIIPFAYENKGNDPEYSHSFMTVIRVFAGGKTAAVTKGLTERRYKNWNFEAFTISWLPHDFDKNPDLCVFDGFGARIFASWNKCPVSVGRDFRLDETLRLGVNVHNAICMWGPYEITKPAFDLAVKRMRLLDSGKIKYRADDRLYRKNGVAINCFHAMAGLEELYPNGGLFGTGFKMWGLNGTARVLIEYKDRGSKMGLLLEPVNEKKDRFGFVYAPTRNSRPTYNPFTTASVYHH